MILDNFDLIPIGTDGHGGHVDAVVWTHIGGPFGQLRLDPEMV
jgi:hypothetical protein